jgi:hypothetical protein
MVRRKKARTASPAGAARPVEPTGEETRLGTFGTNPVVFTLYEVPDEHDEGPEYRVYGDDGAGERLVCWFLADAEAAPVWRGAWNGDDMCVWIEDQARKLVANPEPDAGT